ncbi:single-stranded-DNA-specific exonuclease RecJ [Candidatus Gracilibacteria bacterium]|nr:single-stranded-DNA-specific exonuclease RecJ [Candidatus Gracilibacteria bacterium]
MQNKTSITGKKWQLLSEKFSKNFENFSDFFLYSRKISDKEKFFNGKYPEDLRDGKNLKDIEKGVKRVVFAIEKQERIIIFGDYDCDGIPGTTMLFDALKNLGAQVSYRIPNREKDGYGLKNYFFDEFKEKNVKLVITVDNGISSINEAEYAKKLGIDLIITDHHEVQNGEIPKCIAVINPQRPDCNYGFGGICGAVVAWKFAIEIGKKIKGEEWANKNIRDKHIELAGLSTVADIMPLVDENRIIVKEALEKIKNTKNPGIQAILKEMKFKPELDLDSSFFGFKLGPRINATGRMHEGIFGVQLLLGKTEFAPFIEKLNTERKKIVSGILKKVSEDLTKKAESEGKINELIILHNSNWKSGIIGLIAGKITENLNLPSIVLQDKGDFLVASCRAPEGFNIFELLSNFKDLFEHFGGHEQACGFSIKKENFEKFEKKAKILGKEFLKKSPLENFLIADFELSEKFLNLNFLDEIKKLEPFGKGNESPKFLIKNILPEYFLVGKEKNHMQLKFFGNRAIFFQGGKFFEKLNGKKCDIIFTLAENFFNGKRQLNIMIEDISI